MENLRHFKRWGMLIIAFAIMVSCNNDDGDDAVTVGEPPVADAGADVDVFVGALVTLDGGNSSDPEGGSLTYNWELTDMPTGSNSSITNASNVTASFEADAEGDYVVELTVEDEDGNTAADEILISATVSEGAIVLDADVNEDTTLEDVFSDPSLPDYRVTGDLSINSALIINPGVVIEFEEAASLTINTEGSLNAIGTFENGIVMTGVQKVEGFWQGIFYNNSRIPENELNYVTIEYAGESSFSFRHNVAALVIGGGSSSDQSQVAVSNCIISNSGGAGIDIRSESSFTAFENNAFADNASSAIKIWANHAAAIDGSSVFNDNNGNNYVEVLGGTVDRSGAWTSFDDGSGYLISGNVSVTGGLTLEAGALLVFKQDIAMSVDNSNGSLTVNGTASNKVTMEGEQDLTGYWKGVFFNNTRAGNSVDHAIIKNAGSSSFSFRHNIASVVIGGSSSDYVSSVSITNTLISKSGNHGIDIRSESSFDNFANNEFTDNEGSAVAIFAQHAGSIDSASKLTGNNGDNNNGNVALIQGGTVSQTATWVKFDDSSNFQVVGNVNVTAKLTINAGATLVFGQDLRLEISGQGILDAIGSASDKINFVGLQDVDSYWQGIYFNNSISNENVIDQAVISNGGSSTPSFRHERANIMIGGSSSSYVSNATISNCTISKSGGFGIDIRATSTATISGNTFTANALADVNQQ